MNNSYLGSLGAGALALTLVSGCATPTFQQPASIGPDIARQTGISPAWTTEGVPAPDAVALRNAVALPIPDPLSEVEAVTMALNASPVMAKMISETNAMRAEAIDLSLPQNPIVNLTTGVPLDSMSAVPLFAMLMVQIDELWKQPIRSEAARENYQAALLSLGAGAIALATETRVAWHDIALRTKETELAAHDLDLTERLFSVAQSRFEAGESTADAVAEAHAELVDAHHRLARAEESRIAARLVCMSLLGRAESPNQWQLGEPDPSAHVAIHAPLTGEQKLLELLASSRLDVRAAESRVNAAAATLELARKSRSNSIQGGAGYERDMEGAEAVSIAANIELPIFNDGTARIAKAEAEFETAAIESERVRQAAITELRSAMAKAIAAQAMHDVSAERLLTPSIHTVSRARASHDVGESSRREVLDAEHALNHIMLDMNELERERRGSRLALAKAAGILPTEVSP